MKRLLSTKVYDLPNIDGIIESYIKAIKRDGFETIGDFDRCFDKLREDKPEPKKYRVNVEVIEITNLEDNGH